jgi:hypothetical protein
VHAIEIGFLMRLLRGERFSESDLARVEDEEQDQVISLDWRQCEWNTSGEYGVNKLSRARPGPRGLRLLMED